MATNSRTIPIAAIILLVMLPYQNVGNAQPPSHTSPFIANQLTNLTWNGTEFIVSSGETTSYLYTVGLNGSGVQPFAQSFIGDQEIYAAISDGNGGFPPRHVYVSSGNAIYQMDARGDQWRLFSMPAGASRIGYLAFDRVGSWGNELLAVDDNGLLWSISANGTATIIKDFGPNLKPEGIAVAPANFGSFGGYLFVSLETGPSVVALSPSNPENVHTIVQFPGEEVERILSIPNASDLYVAQLDRGVIFRVPATNLSSYVGMLLVITEGDSKPNGSMNVLMPAGNNISKKTIYVQENHPHFEGADFVPVSSSSFSQSSSSSSASSPSSTVSSSAPIPTSSRSTQSSSSSLSSSLTAGTISSTNEQIRFSLTNNALVLGTAVAIACAFVILTAVLVRKTRG